VEGKERGIDGINFYGAKEHESLPSRDDVKHPVSPFYQHSKSMPKKLRLPPDMEKKAASSLFLETGGHQWEWEKTKVCPHSQRDVVL